MNGSEMSYAHMQMELLDQLEQERAEALIQVIVDSWEKRYVPPSCTRSYVVAS